MPNPLQMGGLPPVPVQDNGSGNALQSGGSGPAASPAGAPAGAMPGAAPPPPSHEQTVAALRHFDAIKSGLVEILQDPATGKSDQKSKIIDGVTRLVSERMISAPTAVQQLAGVPAEPLEQRKWLQKMLQQAVQAEQVILAHHGMGFAGQGPQTASSSPDDHMDHMKALHAIYTKPH